MKPMRPMGIYLFIRGGGTKKKDISNFVERDDWNGTNFEYLTIGDADYDPMEQSIAFQVLNVFRIDTEGNIWIKLNVHDEDYVCLQNLLNPTIYLSDCTIGKFLELYNAYDMNGTTFRYMFDEIEYTVGSIENVTSSYECEGIHGYILYDVDGNPIHTVCFPLDYDEYEYMDIYEGERGDYC